MSATHTIEFRSDFVAPGDTVVFPWDRGVGPVEVRRVEAGPLPEEVSVFIDAGRYIVDARSPLVFVGGSADRVRARENRPGQVTAWV